MMTLIHPAPGTSAVSIIILAPSDFAFFVEATPGTACLSIPPPVPLPGLITMLFTLGGWRQGTRGHWTRLPAKAQTRPVSACPPIHRVNSIGLNHRVAVSTCDEPRRSARAHRKRLLFANRTTAHRTPSLYLRLLCLARRAGARPSRSATNERWASNGWRPQLAMQDWWFVAMDDERACWPKEGPSLPVGSGPEAIGPASGPSVSEPNA